MYEFDLHRIFLGDKPLWFLLEVAFRTVFIFGYTLLLLRCMGKRGMGSLTPFEFAIIIALGSAVGDPMFQDDVPLLHSMLVIALIVGMQQLISLLTEKNKQIERAIMSSPRLLIREGVVDCKNLHHEELSRDDLFQGLCEQGVRQLGQVELAYLEPSGKLSVVRKPEEAPGLSVLPSSPPDDAVSLKLSDRFTCCCCCGLARHGDAGSAAACDNCGGADWTRAVQPRKVAE